MCLTVFLSLFFSYFYQSNWGRWPTSCPLTFNSFPAVKRQCKHAHIHFHTRTCAEEEPRLPRVNWGRGLTKSPGGKWRSFDSGTRVILAVPAVTRCSASASHRKPEETERNPRGNWWHTFCRSKNNALLYHLKQFAYTIFFIIFFFSCLTRESQSSGSVTLAAACFWITFIPEDGCAKIILKKKKVSVLNSFSFAHLPALGYSAIISLYYIFGFI